eukprot:719724-Rhodomonas_salina.1
MSVAPYAMPVCTIRYASSTIRYASSTTRWGARPHVVSMIRSNVPAAPSICTTIAQLSTIIV